MTEEKFAIAPSTEDSIGIAGGYRRIVKIIGKTHELFWVDRKNQKDGIKVYI